MVDDELAKVDIFKFEPGTDIQPRYSTFKVPYKGRTVLDVLRYIYENFDSSLAFRWACGKGYCRCCVVSVNKKPAMACAAPAQKIMKIDPHPKFRVIKDLVVDLNQPK